jgi:hypothetical protein
VIQKSNTKTLDHAGKQLLAITMHVNTQHSEGKSLTNKKLQNWLKQEHHVKVKKEDHGSLCAQVGFVISSGEAMEEVISKYHVNVIPLLKLDKYAKAIASGEDIILVYTDELYIVWSIQHIGEMFARSER